MPILRAWPRSFGSAYQAGDAVDPQDHGLAVDDEMLLPDLARGLDDPRVTIGPVAAVHGEQAYALALPLHQQAEAVVLDFMEPVRTVWNFGPAGLASRSARSGSR